ncbi:hypothetical protein Tco_1363576 [Tanacetum coccineum]
MNGVLFKELGSYLVTKNLRSGVAATFGTADNVLPVSSATTRVWAYPVKTSVFVAPTSVSISVKVVLAEILASLYKQGFGCSAEDHKDVGDITQDATVTGMGVILIQDAIVTAMADILIN